MRAVRLAKRRRRRPRLAFVAGVRAASSSSAHSPPTPGGAADPLQRHERQRLSGSPASPCWGRAGLGRAGPRNAAISRAWRASAPERAARCLNRGRKPRRRGSGPRRLATARSGRSRADRAPTGRARPRRRRLDGCQRASCTAIATAGRSMADRWDDADARQSCGRRSSADNERASPAPALARVSSRTAMQPCAGPRRREPRRSMRRRRGDLARRHGRPPRLQGMQAAPWLRKRRR